MQTCLPMALMVTMYASDCWQGSSGQNVELYRLNNNSKSLRDFLIKKAYNNMLMKDKRYYYIHTIEFKSSEKQFAIEAVYNNRVLPSCSIRGHELRVNR